MGKDGSRFSTSTKRLLSVVKMMLGKRTVLLIIAGLVLLSELALGAPKQTEIATTFLTEDDLYRIIGRGAYAVGAMIALQVLSLWKESKNNSKEEIRSLRKSDQDILLAISELKGMINSLQQRPSISESQAQNISRTEAERVFRFLKEQRGGHDID